MNILGKDITYGPSIKDKSLLSIIFKYSILGSLLLIALTSIQFLSTNLSKSVGLWNARLEFIMMLSMQCIYLVLMIFSVSAYKKSNGENVSFSKAFVLTFSVGIIMTIVNGVGFNLMLYYTNGSDNGASLESIPQSFFHSLIYTFSSLFNSAWILAIVALMIAYIVKRDRT